MNESTPSLGFENFKGVEEEEEEGGNVIQKGHIVILNFKLVILMSYYLS